MCIASCVTRHTCVAVCIAHACNMQRHTCVAVCIASCVAVSCSVLQRVRLMQYVAFAYITQVCVCVSLVYSVRVCVCCSCVCVLHLYTVCVWDALVCVCCSCVCVMHLYTVCMCVALVHVSCSCMPTQTKSNLEQMQHTYTTATQLCVHKDKRNYEWHSSLLSSACTREHALTH